jgi:transcriptional regulator with XRE-family HTH domain
MTDHQAKRLGDLVRDARHQKRVSLRDLEALTGFNESWLSRLERGRYADPNPVQLARLAETLGIDPAAIDHASRDHLANSLPSARTYFRSKEKLSPEALDELELALEAIRAKDAHRRTPEGRR